MTRVLVTGAAGFVGANLVRRLVTSGHAVHAVVRAGAHVAGQSESQPWRLIPPVDAQIHHVDLRDADAVAQAVRLVRPEWVFHCATYGAYSWQRDEARIRDTNVLGTSNLLDACRGDVAVFVNTGSSSEYGYKTRPAAETDVAEPNSAYAESKLTATELCVAAARRRDIGAVVTLRLYSVYGPYEEPNRLMPALLASALRGSLPPLVHPDTARDFVHVDDVCDAYLRVAQQPTAEPGAVFNVGSGTQTTIGELVDTVRTMFGLMAAPRWGSMPARSWDTNVWCADISRIRTQIGWTPRYSLGEGLRRFSAWIAQHPDVRERYVSAMVSSAGPLRLAP